MLPQSQSIPQPSSNDAVCAECAALISRANVRAAVAFLNGRTRFRFTGIYHVDPPHLRNVLLFDRENPDINLSGAVTSLNDTYCALTYFDGPFETGDAQRDDRLVVHPSRDSVISYTGVPLRLANGRIWGTLCHYDVRPRILSPAERSVLQSVAPMFAVLAPGADPRTINDRSAPEPRDSVARRM